MRWIRSALPLALLAAGPLAAQPTAFRSALVATPAWRDSLVILAGGRPVGAQVLAWTTTDGGFEFTEVTALGSAVSQATRVTFGPDGRVRTVHQRGTARDAPIATDLEYTADGRVRGCSSNPGPDGQPQHLAIDTLVGPDAIDDNAMAAFFPALPWRVGAAWEVTIFTSGRNQAEARRLEVVRREEVTVLAGTHEAWRIEVSGGPATVTLQVATAPPHRLLSLAVGGTPLEFQLAP